MSDSINRRRFLQQTAVSGAAVAGAARVLADDNPTPKRTITVGVMGMGGRGTTLAQQFQQQPDCEVAYVCGVDQTRLAAGIKAVEKLSGKAPQGVGDFRRILDDKSVDVLVCAAPDHWHAPATILACSAGKHVYVEKPCCHNPREGEMQVAAARKHDRVVQIGTQRRSYPGLIEAIAKLHDGVIG
ncbi:MAG TPA: Gfo/Idh/MocA family oxidoreductase, partial [Thermoguttaceae bacterium]|nr:Gfo/Idh/MocA family oxidoreductase [Thermoguttaceae bacterium]